MEFGQSFFVCLQRIGCHVHTHIVYVFSHNMRPKNDSQIYVINLSVGFYSPHEMLFYPPFWRSIHKTSDAFSYHITVGARTPHTINVRVFHAPCGCCIRNVPLIHAHTLAHVCAHTFVANGLRVSLETRLFTFATITLANDARAMAAFMWYII